MSHACNVFLFIIGRKEKYKEGKRTEEDVYTVLGGGEIHCYYCTYDCSYSISVHYALDYPSNDHQPNYACSV